MSQTEKKNIWVACEVYFICVSFVRVAVWGLRKSSLLLFFITNIKSY